MIKEIVLVSSNTHKILEYQHKLQPMICIPYESLIGHIDIEEVGTTFKENAYLKASIVHQRTKRPCIADDSGLLVKALPNQLGVRSRRFSIEMTDESNNQLLLNKLKGIKERKATFMTVICFIDESSKPHYFQGELHGRIVDVPRGQFGFGYDPIFEIEGTSLTLAELTLEEKNQYSHRAKAIEALKKELMVCI